MSQLRKLSIFILSAGSDAAAAELIHLCRQLQPAEIIVVTDDNARKAAADANSLNCKIHLLDPKLSRNRPQGYPGGFRVCGDAVLFLRAGEAVVDMTLLRRLLEPVMYGSCGVVLSDAGQRHEESLYPKQELAWAVWFNALAGRSDLQGSSLQTAPFALSKQAYLMIADDLAVNPAAAMLKLFASGIRMERRPAPYRSEERDIGIGFRPEWSDALPSEVSRYERLIIDDYLRAFRQMPLSDRGGYSDGQRRRDLVKDMTEGRIKPKIEQGIIRPASRLYKGMTLAVIIPARNEERTIGEVVRQARLLEPSEIIVVDNGSLDRTAKHAREHGATVIHIGEALGTDCGRAIGAFYSKCDNLLFVDSDFVLAAEEMYPFARAVSLGYDIALNDRSYLLDAGSREPLITATYAMNSALGHKDLGASSMAYVPFAIHRRVLQAINAESLLCPPRALAASLAKGFTPVLASRIRWEKRNRVRTEKHRSGSGLSPAAVQIMGDHIEGLQFLMRTRKESDSSPFI